MSLNQEQPIMHNMYNFGLKSLAVRRQFKDVSIKFALWVIHLLLVIWKRPAAKAQLSRRISPVGQVKDQKCATHGNVWESSFILLWTWCSHLRTHRTLDWGSTLCIHADSVTDNVPSEPSHSRKKIWHLIQGSPFSPPLPQFSAQSKI